MIRSVPANNVTVETKVESTAAINPGHLCKGIHWPVVLPFDVDEPGFDARNEYAAAILSAFSYEKNPERVKQQLAAWGFTDIKLYGWDEKFSTQAIVARRGDEVHVIFRGTKGYKDLDKDLQVFNRSTDPLLAGAFPSARVHRGFRKALDEIWNPTEPAYVFGLARAGVPPLEQVLREEAAKPGTRIVLEGHSLGGALATLTAARLAAAPPLPGANRSIGSQVEAIYTFGMPQLGDSMFAMEYNARFKKVHHLIKVPGDLVSIMPRMGYAEVGTEEWLSDSPNASLPRYTVRAHQMPSYITPLKHRAQKEAEAGVPDTDGDAWPSRLPTISDIYG